MKKNISIFYVSEWQRFERLTKVIVSQYVKEMAFLFWLVRVF